MGLLADRVLGEPPAGLHPVAGFGHLMGAVERRVYRDDARAGAGYAAGGVAAGLLAGRLAGSTALGVAASAAGRMLRAEAVAVGRLLDDGDLDAARAHLASLCGRDPSELDASAVAAAVIESLAENTVDAVVAPALWGSALGAPGALGYRAVNTMDAMVGHRNARYEHFGRVAARLDDAANFLPARVTAALVAAVSPARASAVVRHVRRDAPAHPSPNAGVAEAAFAAALGLELGGTLRYGDRVEHRPRLGTGPRPGPADIARAVHLADRVELGLVSVLTLLAVASLSPRSARQQ
ncbi:MAG TPA: adenosylcobinamide-phosphate synthase CbiB [Acidimicrobiia bacterium]